MLSYLHYLGLTRRRAMAATGLLILLASLPAPGFQRAANAASAAEAVYQKGMAALKDRDLRTARTAFEQAVKLAPRSAEAHNSLGWVLLTQGDLDNAISQFRAALKLRPGLVQASVNLSNALLAKKDIP